MINKKVKNKVCEDETVGIERLFTGESKTFKADGTKDFIGYFYVSNLIAEIDLTINPIISEGSLFPPMNVYSLKSCYPDPSSNFYDNHIEMRSFSSPNQMIITSDCNEMDGGGWFVLVQCHSSPCQFSLSLSGSFSPPFFPSTSLLLILFIYFFIYFFLFIFLFIIYLF